MQAEAADCDAATCRLREHAHISCGALHLYADAIDIHFDPAHQFAGAQARGHTILVQNEVVTTCQQTTVAADQITGTVLGATIEIRAWGAQPDAAGVPQGRNAAVLHGDIERLSPNHFVAHGGDFTSCDCGPNTGPSWRLGATTVDIEVGKRALIWGPQLYINPLSLGLIPITPPLLPLSLPLQKRAMGFLPPLPRKYAGPWLAVDLPFFVPLGESYDVTLFVGIRPDWRDPNSSPSSLHYYGAPRLGLQFRYAPSEGTRGRVQVELTRDGAHGMAQQVLIAEGLVLDAANASARLLHERRVALVNRVSIDMEHKSRLAPRLDWLLYGHWRSDDLIPKDFALQVGERFATYLPSRSQLTWRAPRGAAVAAADWLLRLDNVAIGPDGVALPVFSNTDGTESGTMHRGPMLAWQWLPVPLGAGFTLDGALNAVRLGPWSQSAPTQSTMGNQIPAVQSRAMAGLTGGLGWQGRVGPVGLTARAGVDGLLVAPAHARAYLDTAIVTSAGADVRLARRFGAWRHMLDPTLQYRGLAAHPLQAPHAVDMLHALDEREVRRLSHQMLLKLRQHLSHPPSGTRATLDLAQPLDLRSGAWLSPWGTLQWSHPRYGAASVRASYDYRHQHDLPLRELAVAYNVSFAFVRLSAAYDRLAPDADKFVRSIYELAAPRLPVQAYETSAPWVHLVRGGVGLALPSGFSVGYGAQYQLHPPGAAVSPCASAPGAPPGENTRGCFIQHTVSAEYTSPCHCWGIRADLAMVPQDLVNPTRFNVTFAVADTVVSMEPMAY